MGHQVVNYITIQSAKNSTATHEIIETYLHNKPIPDVNTPLISTKFLDSLFIVKGPSLTAKTITTQHRLH